jgi:hypothetical protein
MIFFSVGLPGRFAEWCDAVTSRLAKHALGSVEVLSLNTLEELALAMIRTGGSHFVVCSRQPGGGVQTALMQVGKRFIAVLDEPRVALRDLALRPGYDLVGATRAVASSCAAMLGYSSLPGALVLTAGNEGQDPLSIATAIARHLELDVNAAEIEKIICVLRDEGIVPERSEDSVWWDSLAEPEQALVNGALGAYIDHFAGGDLTSITWGRELFFIGDQPNERATRPVDVTGRARCLIYGPYITLPPGSWSVSVLLGFSKEAAELGYIVEVVAGTHLSRVNLQPEGEGVFEVNLAISIEASMDHPAEVRLFSERAGFDGKLALGQVTLRRQLTSRPEKRSEFASTLGLLADSAG